MKFNIEIELDTGLNIGQVQDKVHKFLEAMDPLYFREGGYSVSGPLGETLGGRVICEGITHKVKRGWEPHRRGAGVFDE